MCIFLNDTATTEIYTLSLHDALPICGVALLDRRDPVDLEHAGRQHGEALGVEGEAAHRRRRAGREVDAVQDAGAADAQRDRKSTRLNSSHANISYAVFCLKKQNMQRL